MSRARATDDDLADLGFEPRSLQVVAIDVPCRGGRDVLHAKWRTTGTKVSDGGLYAFTVDDQVMYVGMTTALEMVTHGVKGNSARGPQRYGGLANDKDCRPTQTRLRVNSLVNEQLREGRRVLHWLLPLPTATEDELRHREAELIRRWNLTVLGWNRQS